MNKLSILAIIASALLFSCGGEDAKSKPIKESAKKEAKAPDVNAKPEKFDPAKSQTQSQQDAEASRSKLLQLLST